MRVLSRGSAQQLGPAENPIPGLSYGFEKQQPGHLGMCKILGKKGTAGIPCLPICQGSMWKTCRLDVNSSSLWAPPCFCGFSNKPLRRRRVQAGRLLDV